MATKIATRTSADETSERKRISIPKADESVLAWWDEQKDSGLSVRLLIRNEIERSGYTDTAFRPVAQLPRRGRPPGAENIIVDPQDESLLESAIETAGGVRFSIDDAPALDQTTGVFDPLAILGNPVPAPVLVPEPTPVAPAVQVPVAPTLVAASAAPPTRTRTHAAAPASKPVVAAAGFSSIDDLMNG